MYDTSRPDAEHVVAVCVQGRASVNPAMRVMASGYVSEKEKSLAQTRNKAW
jgi:hypothetical protein